MSDDVLWGDNSERKLKLFTGYDLFIVLVRFAAVGVVAI
jgi:hypothetical protein